VRQAVIQYLITTLKVPVNLIGVEFSLTGIVPGNFRRADIVVYKPGGNQLAPWLLVECKAPRIKIDDEVAYQTAHYLKNIPSLFVMLSNGKDSRYLERVSEAYQLIKQLPVFTK